MSRNEEFVADRRLFFGTGYTKETVKEHANKKATNYKFLLKNHYSLETEFENLLNALKDDAKDADNEAFWVYCYYCATLLEAFFKAQDQQENEKKFTKHKAKILRRLNGKAEPKVPVKSFEKSLFDDIVAAFHSLLASPAHPSVIRANLGWINLVRVYLVFSRLTLTQGLNLAKNIHLIDKLDAFLGTHTDVAAIIKVFEAPIEIFNFASVGLFLARSMIDLIFLVRHVFIPSKLEQGNKTTKWDRLKYELYKRQGHFLNDFVWASVNLLTNFKVVLDLSGPVSNYLMVAFLVFDLLLIVYLKQLARNEFETKRKQYEIELHYYNDPTNLMSQKDKEAHIRILTKQLHELEVSWRAKESHFNFLAAAAGLFIVGFGVTVLVSSPAVILACLLLCTVAVAMYRSSDSYAQFQEKNKALEYARLHASNRIPALSKEYEAARNHFIFTMVQNTVMPLVLIATIAVCWPAAIVLAAVFVGYKLYDAKQQHKTEEEVAALPSFA